MPGLTLEPKDVHGDAELAAMLDVFAVTSEALGIDGRECAALVGVRASALPLRPGRPALTADQERRVRYLIDIGGCLGLLIGDPDEIVEWMRTPRPDWCGLSPVGEMLRGRSAVGELRRRLLDECHERFGHVEPRRRP